MAYPKNRKQKTIEQRFWSKVQKGDGCWTWTGAVNPRTGYGALNLGRRGLGIVPSHRASYQINKGPVPDGLVVMHLCNNKVCVNPAHLKAGSYAENNKSAWDDGLKPKQRIQRSWNSSISDEMQRGMIEKRSRGWTLKAIGLHYGVHLNSVFHQLRRGKLTE